MLDGALSGSLDPSFPETSFYSHSTPINASQVTNVSTSQVANLSNSITAFIPGTSPIANVPRTIAAFTPGNTASLGHSTPSYASSRTSQIGAETVISSGLLYQLNLRP